MAALPEILPNLHAPSPMVGSHGISRRRRRINNRNGAVYGSETCTTTRNDDHTVNAALNQAINSIRLMRDFSMRVGNQQSIASSSCCIFDALSNFWKKRIGNIWKDET